MTTWRTCILSLTKAHLRSASFWQLCCYSELLLHDNILMCMSTISFPDNVEYYVGCAWVISKTTNSFFTLFHFFNAFQKAKKSNKNQKPKDKLSLLCPVCILLKVIFYFFKTKKDCKDTIVFRKWHQFFFKMASYVFLKFICFFRMFFLLMFFYMFCFILMFYFNSYLLGTTLLYCTYIGTTLLHCTYIDFQITFWLALVVTTHCGRAGGWQRRRRRSCRKSCGRTQVS